MENLYKLAKLDEVINKAIKNLLKEAKTFTDNFLVHVFWKNIVTGKASLHIYDDKVMISYQIDTIE